MSAKHKKTDKATFAAGCFWCAEHDFEEVDGVIEVISGYTGGQTENPSYEDVCSGKTGHVEAIEVHFDPDRVTYKELLDVFWRQIDPTDSAGQFVDRGSQYRSAIFYHNEKQQRLAEKSKAGLDQSGRFDRPVVTEILPRSIFYPAEDYHQNFCRKNADRYKSYRRNSGRDRFLKKAWPKPGKGE
ncbi:MAG: peptide-methionine (S)-S-oxide reductase MsrA [Thermodesulfobacteriota bacterium]|nr:peptide-methionine (S)-S-oxide reductase MsrA [Thermodesulfobacteriota bacterium]